MSLAVFIAAFFVLHMPKIVWFNLHENNWLMQVAKAVNNISESALSNSNKSIQFSQLQKVIQICMAHRKQQQQLQKKKKKEKHQHLFL